MKHSIDWSCELCGYNENKQEKESCDACGFMQGVDVPISQYLEQLGIKQSKEEE